MCPSDHENIIRRKNNTKILQHEIRYINCSLIAYACLSCLLCRALWMATYLFPQISCPVYDDFIDLLDSPQPPSSKGSDSPLLETTCIVLPSSLLPLPEKPGSGSFITAMDLIAMAGFEVCGLRMTQLSEDKARALCFACTSEIKVGCPLPCSR